MCNLSFIHFISNYKTLEIFLSILYYFFWWIVLAIDILNDII